jgi:hypothetical protein
MSATVVQLAKRLLERLRCASTGSMPSILSPPSPCMHIFVTCASLSLSRLHAHTHTPSRDLFQPKVIISCKNTPEIREPN